MAAPEQRSDAKQRLLEKFLRGEMARQTWDAPIEPRAPGVAAPLAPGQHLIWLSAQMTASEPIYNAPITIHHRGPFDLEILRRAFSELTRRHEILRTTFASVDGEVVQAVHDDIKIQIPFLDLSALSEASREQEANQEAVADALRLFDLGVGPLVRARLVKLEPEYHRVYLTVHHAIFDGVSIYNVLLPELAAIYEAFAADEPSPLPEPRYQYSDFALWQKRMLDNDSVSRQIEYWRGQLAGELPDLQLPSDRPRPAAHSYRGSMKKFALPAELTAALRTAAGAEGVTLYMFLLAAFKTLLHRYSGQSDVMVGGVSGARRRPEFQKLIGNFSNFFALRTHPAPEATFREYLAQVKDTVLGAMANGDVPLDQVIREVQPRRESARRPFFQVTFSMEPLSAEPPRPNWYVTQMDTVTGYTKFDLYFEIDERPTGLFARFDYSTDLFDRSTMDRMASHWLTLLRAAIESPEAKLCDLALISAEEEQLLRSPVDNTYVLDMHRHLAPAGLPGELYITGEGVPVDAEHFIPHPFQTNGKLFRTGELARRRPDGTLERLGRIADQIKVRGFSINPGAIEAALLDHPEVHAAAVRMWPDESGNPAIVAYVAGDLPKEDLPRFLQPKLPDYMIPARFVALDALPLTPDGKVDRSSLPPPAIDPAAARSTAPRNEMERKLVAIWESVLGVESVGIEDNFFDLGGYSFQVAKLLRKIEVEFGARLSMAALFEAPTVAHLAEVLGKSSKVAHMSRIVNLQSAGMLEPLFWIYGGPLFRSLAQSLGAERPFLGVGMETNSGEDFSQLTFVEHASRLVEIIRARQPHGPYYLGGWCSSGLLAYEMASQLIDAGEKVGTVVMLDAPNPAHYFKISKHRLLASKATYHLRRLTRANIGEMFPYAWNRTRGLVKHLFERRSEVDQAFQLSPDIAIMGYDPQPIQARVLVYQPADRPAVWDLRKSWAPHLHHANFEVHDVPGNHLSMFEEPHVGGLAENIKKNLRGNVVEIRRAVAS